MPRIDPQQLLTCLQVLLSPQGGILSKDEVQRLANLMTKFSKKLVSKCIYLLILKSTDKELLGSFMAEGGWSLVYIWLQDANTNKNWALVTEVLELLLVCPVDVERLKMNNMPKLIKSFTKREDLPGIQQISTTLVDDWLKLVKDVTKAEKAEQAVEEIVETTEVAKSKAEADVEPMQVDEVDNAEDSDNSKLKHDKPVNCKVETSNEESCVSNSLSSETPTVSETDSKDDKKKDRLSGDRSRHKSGSSSSKSSSSRSSRDKSRDDKHGRSSSSSSKSKDRDKHRSNGSSKHRSSSSSKHSSKDREKKDSKQADKDKDTLSKLQPQALDKIGRIPKKSDSDKSKSLKREETKKPSFSVEVRKNNEEKPKTVKIFNSKMRSTGLLDEVKPPPPRSAAKKSAPTMPPPVLPTKRSSPLRDIIPPPEKKSRLLDIPERPGAIKLIPPKPKPAVLQESDIFMDALTASATTKKEPKKRKRRPSTSKESSPPPSPANTTPVSPIMKSITANFYQDTLETSKEDDSEKDKENQENSMDTSEVSSTPAEPDEDGPEPTKTDANGLKGVLLHAKRKKPKRSIRWRPDAELVEIQYFELDETERVNVMKPFMDMARMEMTSEREALRSRKLPNEDTMDTQMPYRTLMQLDLPPPQAEIGSKSFEKDIQFAREKRVLQAIYFNNRIPESAAEPDPESYTLTNPVIIPLDDPDNPEQEAPLQPWPEPKGSPPHIPNIPPMFPNIGPPFMGMNGPPNGFPPNGMPPFQPPFMPPNMMRPPGPDWGPMPNGMPPNMPPPDMMNQGPPMFDNYGPPDNFPPPFNPPPNNNMPMFPPNNFNNNNNNMRGRGGFRRGNNGPWVRMAGPGPNPQGSWNGRGGGMNRGGGRHCLNIKKHGFCRNRDNCPFVH